MAHPKLWAQVCWSASSASPEEQGWWSPLEPPQWLCLWSALLDIATEPKIKVVKPEQRLQEWANFTVIQPDISGQWFEHGYAIVPQTGFHAKHSQKSDVPPPQKFNSMILQGNRKYVKIDFSTLVKTSFYTTNASMAIKPKVYCPAMKSFTISLFHRYNLKF